MLERNYVDDTKLRIELFLRNNKINIPKIKRKLIITNIIERKIYGYTSDITISMIGLNNALISDLTSSRLSILTHSAIRVVLNDIKQLLLTVNILICVCVLVYT